MKDFSRVDPRDIEGEIERETEKERERERLRKRERSHDFHEAQRDDCLSGGKSGEPVIRRS